MIISSSSFFPFFPFFFVSVSRPDSVAHTAEQVKAQTKLRFPQQYLHSIYDTASTAEQPATGPAQSSEVYTGLAVCSCRPHSRVRQRKPADKKKCFDENPYVRSIIFLCQFSPLVVVVLWIKRVVGAIDVVRSLQR